MHVNLQEPLFKQTLGNQMRQKKNQQLIEISSSPYVWKQKHFHVHTILGTVPYPLPKVTFESMIFRTSLLVGYVSSLEGNRCDILPKEIHGIREVLALHRFREVLSLVALVGWAKRRRNNCRGETNNSYDLVKSWGYIIKESKYSKYDYKGLYT